MRLVELKVNDLRRFPELTLGLAPGVNLLTGPNGSGKTTVLEAIGFALFGAPCGRGGADASAVRDGAKELAVEARFEQDGRAYVVTRSRDSSGERARLVDPASKRTLATGRDEVASQIAALLRVTRKDELELLFSRLVGVAQGELTTPFLLGPDARRNHFEPLLDLDRYEVAGARTIVAGERLRARMSDLDRERQRSQKELGGYEQLIERMTKCDTAIDAARGDLLTVEKRIVALDARAAELDEVRAKVDALTLESAVLEEAVRNRERDVERAKKILDEAEQAHAVVEQTRAAHSRAHELDAEIRALELRRREHDGIRAEVDALERRLGAGRSAIDGERAELDSRLEANQRRAEELLEEREALRGHLETLRTRSRRAEGTQTALGMALTRSERLRAAVAEVPAPPEESTDEVERREAEARVREVEARRREKEARRAELQARRAEEAAEQAASEALAAELDALRARSETLDAARHTLSEAKQSAARVSDTRADFEDKLAAVSPTHGACPLLGQPCSNIGGTSLVTHYETQIADLAEAQASADEAIRFAEARVGEAQAARRELTKKEREAKTRDGRKKKTTRKAARTASEATSGDADARVPDDLATLDFDGVAHHVSALAGVLGAIDGPGLENDRPTALITAVAGSDQEAQPAVRFELPRSEQIDRVERLAHDGRKIMGSPPSPERDRRVHEIATELAGLARSIHATVTTAEAQLRKLITEYMAATHGCENRLLDSSREVERLSLERTRTREEIKDLSSRDLGLLDTEIALGDKRLKLGAYEDLERGIAARRTEFDELKEQHDRHQAHVLLASRLETERAEWQRADDEHSAATERRSSIDEQLAASRATLASSGDPTLIKEREETHLSLGTAREAVRSLERERGLFLERLDELGDVRHRLDELTRSRDRAGAAIGVVGDLAATFQSMVVPIAAGVRAEVEREANRLYRQVSGRPARLVWGDDYGLTLTERTGPRAYADLARGEQTVAALAVQLALLQQFPHLGLLLLDEPTAHLDSDRRRGLADALSLLRDAARDWVEQIVVVSHDDAFDPAAEHHVRLTL